MLTLDELVLRLQEDCPAEARVPSEAQYERAIKEAVADFGNRAGRVKRATLQIVAGIATYDLPADFLKIVKMGSLFAQDGLIISAQGLIPVNTAYAEEYRVNGQTITFYPTPAYTLARDYRYKAGWALSVQAEGEVYEELTSSEAGIVMLLAQSLAKRKIENAADGGFSYHQGDVSVDTTGAANSVKASAESLKADYLEAVEAYVGTVLVMG
jgi:hypothetical protein